MPADRSRNLFSSVPRTLGYAAYLDQSEDMVFTHLDQLRPDHRDVVPFNLPDYPSYDNVGRSLVNFVDSLS
jgi:hypothetical protein